MSNSKELKKCLCCGNKDIRTILDLGRQPLANSYHNGKKLPTFPLTLRLCEECWHLQLSHAVNPDLMFKNYLYVSGTSKTLRDYFDWFVEFTLTFNQNAKNILDIACNDGTQLDSFKRKGLTTYGIDPATNLSKISSDKGHNIIVDYFNKESIDVLNNVKFDIITAQNVFAHNTYPLQFLKQCKDLLNDNGYLFIQTSQANMVLNNEFDTIYHEHISFFSVSSMNKLVSKSGLYLNDVIKTNIHGTSYVFVISKKNYSNNKTNNDKLNDTLTYINYSLNAHKITYDLKKTIKEYKDNGYYVIGYGAAAKGNTLLNFGKIELNYIIDDNDLKWELLTPGMNIPIKGPKFISEIATSKPIVFIPLAWNFYDEIRKNIKEQRNNDEDIFIKYFPELTIGN
jgi:SAM-dependent methyltransferase